MANMSNFLENKLIDFLFRQQTYTPPTALYFGLFTTPPTDSTPGVEPAAPSYSRAGTATGLTMFSSTNAPDDTEISAGSSGITYNQQNIVFPDPEEEWGAVTHVGVFDAITGGNYLFWGELIHPRDFVVGDVNIQFQPGEISFRIDN